MLRSRFGHRTNIASVNTQKAQTKQLSYKDGVDSYTDNDDVKPTALVYATDARMVKKGRYKTRKGAERYSVPVGEAVSTSATSTSGASVQIVSASRALAEKITVGTAGAITKSEINIRTTATSSGVLLVEYYSDVSNAPGVLLCRSSIPSSAINSSFTYVPAYFIKAPAVTASQVVWLVIRGQSENTGSFEVSTTTNSTSGYYSSDNTAYQTISASLNYKLYTSPANPVKGLYRAYRSNGLAKTLFVAHDSLYTVDDLTGATTVLHSTLPTNAVTIRFDMAQDTVYFTDGLNKPYKHDLATNTTSSVSTAPASALSLMEHKGVMFYINADDRSQVYYSNFGQYDVFTSTDFLTFGSPKSPYQLNAFAKLNGALYAFARKNKYVLLGDSNATWSIDEATDQGGTFSQESVAYTENYIFYANDDGIWQFNGTESRNIAEPFLNEYLEIPNKSNSIVLDVRQNRLYVFHTLAGDADNSACFVFNTLLNVYEGKDLGTYVGKTFARFAQDNVFLQGSNMTAAIYYGEPDTNDHTNLGDQLHFELRTAFSHFDSPAQNKRLPKWRPIFGSASGQYTVDVGYAVDGQSNIMWLDPVSLGRASNRYNTGLLYNSGLRYSVSGGQIEPLGLFVSGEFKRIQRIYRHIAAHEPVEMDSEVLTIQTQRLH